jgi:hypothetical protein
LQLLIRVLLPHLLLLLLQVIVTAGTVKYKVSQLPDLYTAIGQDQLVSDAALLQDTSQNWITSMSMWLNPLFSA